jgi:ABC-type oligopeptide transport system substrate-binding subunit
MIEPINRTVTANNSKWIASYDQLRLYLNLLEKKSISTDLVAAINVEIEELNSIADQDEKLPKMIRKKQYKIVRLVEKKHKIVPQKYYRNMWFLLGASVIGLPLGILSNALSSNIDTLGLGPLLGMLLGMALGAVMDKKALKEGRQLEVELKNLFAF